MLHFRRAGACMYFHIFLLLHEDVNILQYGILTLILFFPIHNTLDLPTVYHTGRNYENR